MKKSISKLISILTIFSMCSNGFAGDFFKYNSQRKLILPNPNIDYKSLTSDERSRFTSLLKDNLIKKSIGENKVDKFSKEAGAYDGTFGWHDQYKDAVQVGMKDIIGKLDKLQSDPKNRAIFHRSRSNEDFNFYGQMDPAGTPRFCSAYPQITKNNVDAFYKGDERVDKGVAYSGCYGKESISIPIKKLVTDFSGISNFMMRKKEQKAREQMMIVAANAMLDQRQRYQGLYDNYPKFDPELKSCLKKKSSLRKGRHFSNSAKFPGLKKILERVNSEGKDISEQGKDSSLLPKFNNYNAMLAIVAKNHFDKRNSLRQEYRQLTISLGNQSRVCRHHHRKNESGKDCLARIRKRKKDRANKAMAIKIEIDKQDAALQTIMSESPSLFKIDNFGGFFSGADLKIRPSHYMSSIMKVDGAQKLARELDKGVVNIPEGKNYKKVRANAIEQLGKKHGDEIHSLLAKLKGNKNIKESGNDAVYKQISKIDDSLKSICENEGESLQQYTSMFPSILNNVVNSANSKGEAVKDLEDVQAGLCSLYRKDPPDKNRQPSPAQTVIGWGLILGGSALGVATFWTGVGAGAGMAIAATGSAMALGGSAVFAEHAYSNYLDAKIREHNGAGMLSTSWGDVRKLIDAQSDRINSRNETITQAAFAAPDMIGLGLLANSARAVKVAARSGEASGNTIAKIGKLSSGPHRGAGTRLVKSTQKNLVLVKSTGREIVPKVYEGEIISGPKIFPVGRAKAGEIIDVEVITKKLPASPKVIKVSEIPKLPAPAKVKKIPKISKEVPMLPSPKTSPILRPRFSTKSKPAFKVAAIGDIPKNVVGKNISWMGKDGVRRYGVVEKVNKKSLRIAGRKTLLRLQNVNGSSISAFNDGRRLASAADLPNNMMGQMISFFSPSGNRVQGVFRGQLIKRNRSSFVVRVANDSTIPINPADASTFTIKRIPYSKVHGDSIAHVSLGNTNGLRELASADDFKNLTGKQVSFYSPYSTTLNKNMYVVGLNASKKGVILRRPIAGKAFDAANPSTYKEEIFYFSTNRINAKSIAVTEKVIDHKVSHPLIKRPKTELSLVKGKRSGPLVSKVYEGKLIPAGKTHPLGQLKAEEIIDVEVITNKLPAPKKVYPIAKLRETPRIDAKIKVKSSPIKGQKPSFTSRLSDLWRKGREALRRAVKETSTKVVAKRAARSAVHVGNAAARIIADLGEESAPDNSTGAQERTPVSESTSKPKPRPKSKPKPKPKPQAIIPVNSSTSDADEASADSEFSSDRDDSTDKDDGEGNKEKVFSIPPAPRGNPVTPATIQFIKPAIQVKTGTY